MNVVYLSGTAAECSPTFDESECKRAMVAAAEAGAEKILIADKRIWNLAEKNNLVGEGLTYPTYDDLKNKVKGYLSDYIEMDGFYGVSIYDEPVYEFTVSLRYIYNAVYDAWAELVEEKNITKAIKDYIYIYICLLPYSSTYSRYGAPGQFTDMGEAYKHYIESYLTPTLEGIVDENGEPFIDTIKRAKDKVENSVEEGLLSGKYNATGAIFNLKNNYGWRDKQEVEQSGELNNTITVKLAGDVQEWGK
jgi:hypothetical protein